MVTLRTFFGGFGLCAGRCPACGSRIGAPLCASCRMASGIEDSAVCAPRDGDALAFVGAYRLPAGAFHWQSTSSTAGGADRRELSPLGSALHRFKDRGDRYAGRCLSELFASRCAVLATGMDRVVPIPSDASRLRRRGLSPAAWLARRLARTSCTALSLSALVRSATRPPQRNLGGAARRANARGAFRLGADPVRGYSILLVDDVVTTGATLRDAAARLHEGGAASVVCAVLACADEEVLALCRSKTENTGRFVTRPPAP